MRTVAIINQKGGCGKTTVAINLSAALCETGKRVLLVDLDPQSHASIGLDVSYHDVQYTTYDLLRDPRVRTADCKYVLNENFHIIPSSPVLSAIEQELAGKPARETKLAAKLSRMTDEYDYVIIDSPPNVGLLTFNALMAVGEVIIPVEPSFFSLQGLDRLRETLELLEKETRHRATVRILVNNIEKRTNFSRDIVSELERHHGGLMLDTVISHSVKYKEAALRGVSIFEMDRADRLRWEFQTLASELEEKRASVIDTADISDWMVRLHGPQVAGDSVIFSLDAPGAKKVCLTGEFTNWSHEGLRMLQDEKDGRWKLTMPLGPGEYEYRFIVDGVWIKDPKNVDSVLNEFGQENSLLII